MESQKSEEFRKSLMLNKELKEFAFRIKKITALIRYPDKKNAFENVFEAVSEMACRSDRCMYLLSKEARECRFFEKLLRKIPFRLKLIIIDYIQISISNLGLLDFYGYFKYDRTRKIFLVFRSVVFNEMQIKPKPPSLVLGDTTNEFVETFIKTLVSIPLSITSFTFIGSEYCMKTVENHETIISSTFQTFINFISHLTNLEHISINIPNFDSLYFFVSLGDNVKKTLLHAVFWSERFSDEDDTSVLKILKKEETVTMEILRDVRKEFPLLRKLEIPFYRNRTVDQLNNLNLIKNVKGLEFNTRMDGPISSETFVFIPEFQNIKKLRIDLTPEQINRNLQDIMENMVSLRKLHLELETQYTDVFSITKTENPNLGERNDSTKVFTTTLKEFIVSPLKSPKQLEVFLTQIFFQNLENLVLSFDYTSLSREPDEDLPRDVGILKISDENFPKIRSIVWRMYCMHRSCPPDRNYLTIIESTTLEVFLNYWENERTHTEKKPIISLMSNPKLRELLFFTSFQFYEPRFPRSTILQIDENLPGLKKLSFRGYSFSSPDLFTLANSRNLEELRLCYCAFPSNLSKDSNKLKDECEGEMEAEGEVESCVIPSLKRIHINDCFLSSNDDITQEQIQQPYMFRKKRSPLEFHMLGLIPFFNYAKFLLLETIVITQHIGDLGKFELDVESFKPPATLLIKNIYSKFKSIEEIEYVLTREQYEEWAYSYWKLFELIDSGNINEWKLEKYEVAFDFSLHFSKIRVQNEFEERLKNMKKERSKKKKFRLKNYYSDLKNIYTSSDQDFKKAGKQRKELILKCSEIFKTLVKKNTK